MKDILRPILELLVVLPGLLLGYFPVKTYLKQSPGRLTAWLFLLMACLCIGSGLACYRLHVSTVFALAGVALAAICLYTRTLTIASYFRFSLTNKSVFPYLTHNMEKKQ